jgi:chromosome segregation protein
MKLTSLDLLGFKSFLNRTSFRFNEGVTCIVGPNGCGKSNIVDAVAWVLGERGTKSLRVKEMGEVIFHGSTARKQVNMAEVAMGLANEEKEYSIKRRIYRDGTNEYYINGEMVRLKDVQDFLLGAGVGLHSYAIIEQGNVEYFAQMKPHDRRVAVEETSGIARFEEKKRDAYFRMEEVKTNLERVEDVHREVIKNYEKALEESARLRACQDLKERLKEFDIALLRDGAAKLEKRAARLKEREESLVRELEAAKEAIKGVKERMRTKEEEMGLIDSVARQVELDIKSKEKDMETRRLEIAYIEEEKTRLQRTAEDLQKEMDEVDGKIRLYATEIKDLDRSAAAEAAALAESEGELGRLEAQRDEERSARQSLEDAVEEQRNDFFGAMTRLTEIKNGILAKEKMQKERLARRQRRIEEERAIAGKLRLLEEKAASLKQSRDRELAQAARMQAEEKELTERCDGGSREIGGLRAAIEGLKGIKKGKEEIFRQMGSYGISPKKSAIPCRQLITMLRASKETERIMERFFPREMEYHALTEQDAARLSLIATENGGNFVFFPKKGMFELNGEEADVRLTRVEDLPEAFRRIDDGEEGLFLSGDILVDSRGFISKGQEKGALSIREFREKMKLESELAETEAGLRTKTSRLNGLLSSQQALEKDRQAAQEKRMAHAGSLASAERELVQCEAEIGSLRERLRERTSGFEAAPGEEDGWTVQDEEIRERLRWENEKNRIEDVLSGLRKKLEEVKESCDGAEESYRRMSIAIERTRNQVKKYEEETARKKSAIEALHREKQTRRLKASEAEAEFRSARLKGEELEKRCETLQEDCIRTTARYEEMKGRLGDGRAERAALQEELRTIAEEYEKTVARKESVEREKLVLQEKQEALERKLRDEYGVEAPAEGPVPVVRDETEREKILEELAELGDVNFRAEKECAELKERHEFLEKQRADLASAMESLQKTITKMDSVSRELFLETFARVNESFKGFANTLFKGGQGTLTLNSETNGIDLYVQPPGKKVVRMELLSGGEKALISLAFLLSLMNTRASPFTLMDEIDAPLDDANLLSLLEIMKTISRKTQVILITHNRITMESSNTIYGITMEDAGVSKTVSMRL